MRVCYFKIRIDQQLAEEQGQQRSGTFVGEEQVAVQTFDKFCADLGMRHYRLHLLLHCGVDWNTPIKGRLLRLVA